MNRQTMTYEKETAKLVLFWLIVGIPLGWGVWQVVSKSLVLVGMGG